MIVWCWDCGFICSSRGVGASCHWGRSVDWGQGSSEAIQRSGATVVRPDKSIVIVRPRQSVGRAQSDVSAVTAASCAQPLALDEPTGGIHTRPIGVVHRFLFYFLCFRSPSFLGHLFFCRLSGGAPCFFGESCTTGVLDARPSLLVGGQYSPGPSTLYCYWRLGLGRVIEQPIYRSSLPSSYMRWGGGGGGGGSCR